MDGALRGAAKVVAKSRAAIALRLLFPIALLEVALWSPLPIGVLCGVCAIWYITWQLWQAASDARSLGLDLRGLLRESWLLGTTLLLAVCDSRRRLFLRLVAPSLGTSAPLACGRSLRLLGVPARVHVAVLLSADVARSGFEGQLPAIVRRGIRGGSPAQPQPHLRHLLRRSRLHRHLRS